MEEIRNQAIESPYSQITPLALDRVNVEAYDRLAEEYDSFSHATTRALEAVSKLGYIEFYKLYGNYLNTPVIEIGSGTGNITNHLLKNFSKITAIDISPSMIEIAKRKLLPIFGKKVIFKQISILSPPHDFFDMQYNLVICSLADPYLIREAVTNIKKIMKPGGFVFITIPGFEWAMKERTGRLKTPFFMTRFKLKDNMIVSPYSITYSPNDAKELLISEELQPLNLWEISINSQFFMENGIDIFQSNPPTVLCMIARYEGNL